MSNDPLAAVVYQTIRDWLQNKIPAAPPYADLTAKSSALMMELVSRIKQLNLADRPLEFSSFVSSSTQEPKIRITWGEYEGQVFPFEARELSAKLFDVAHAAESDAFLFYLITVKFELEPQIAYGVLTEFREWREKAAAMQAQHTSRVEVYLKPEKIAGQESEQ